MQALQFLLLQPKPPQHTTNNKQQTNNYPSESVCISLLTLSCHPFVLRFASYFLLLTFFSRVHVGCGKTSLCNEFTDADFWVLDEGFMDMPAYALHPQSLLMETTWVCQWFTRLLKKMSELKAAHNGEGLGIEQIFVADRSPFSACFYSQRGGHLLDPVIREQIKEVREAAGIEVYTVHCKVEKETLWKRIQERLVDQPERTKYNEDKRSWMDKTLEFYDNFNWDIVVNNTDTTMPHLMQDILRKLAVRSPQLKKILKHEDSPGKFYFRKTLGQTFVLEDTKEEEEVDENRRKEMIMNTPTQGLKGSQEEDEFGPVPFVMELGKEPSP